MYRQVLCRLAARLAPAALVLLLSSCVLKKQTPENEVDLAAAARQPLSPEETKALLNDAAGNWFYGQGMGRTMMQVGAIVVFPPYALFLLGNAALTAGGYQPLRFSDALPPDGRDRFLTFYNDVSSGPGRFSAALAGREFITEEVAKERLARYLKRKDSASVSSPQ